MTDSSAKQITPRSRHMAIRETGGKQSPVAVRLRLLRNAIFDENATVFAARVGISVKRLNNFETGYPLSIEVAKRIRAAVPGMTTDWLYFGDERALPVEMLTKLRAETAKSEPSVGKGKGKSKGAS